MALSTAAAYRCQTCGLVKAMDGLHTCSPQVAQAPLADRVAALEREVASLKRAIDTGVVMTWDQLAWLRGP